MEYYSYKEKGHYKNRCPKKEQVVMIGEELPNHSEWAMIQELKNDYKGYSWTAYYNDQCQVHLLEKQDSGWFPREPRSY